MEPRDDENLSALLREWTAPRHSADLEDRVMRARRVWWQALFTGSIRVPIPVACGLAIVIAIGGWRVMQPSMQLNSHAQLVANCTEAPRPVACQPNQRC